MNAHDAHERAAPSSTHSLVRAREFVFQRFVVRVTRGPDAGLECELNAPEFGIGTSPANELVLTDPTVSRHHCIVRAVEDGSVLRDLDSKNGTYLAGFRIQAAHLADGAVVEIGDTLLSFRAVSDRAAEPISDSHGFGALLGSSVAMRHLFHALPKIAASSVTLLLEGETGTGKGLLAEAVHEASPRARGPFVVVDCSAIPRTLIESELFGHSKGAFTGAHAARPGAFEVAAGGTIFLDEIGELPLDMQPKLLRALEERTVKRLGSTETVRLDVRVIAATNRDLRQEVNRGTFRSDLFYRLNVVHLRIPPLRERRDDIALLVAHFYRQIVATEAAPPAELITALSRQDWPGNVRELRSAVERAVLMEDAELWRLLSTSEASSASVGVDRSGLELSFRAAKEHAIALWENEYVGKLIGANHGNVSAAARAARMDRNHLRELLLKHGLVSRRG